MKRLYVCLGFLGMLAPIGVLYAVNYDRKIPGAIIDLGLLFFSAGVSIIFIPLGMSSGLFLAAIIYFIWNRIMGTRPSFGASVVMNCIMSPNATPPASPARTPASTYRPTIAAPPSAVCHHNCDSG
jgi:hypothetical protein